MKDDIRTIARHYVHPIDREGRLSPLYAGSYTYTYYEKKFGKEVWEEACTKARTEYNFGSKAVKW